MEGRSRTGKTYSLSGPISSIFTVAILLFSNHITLSRGDDSYQIADAGTFDGTVWSEKDGGIELIATKEANWRNETTMFTPPFDDRGDLCPIFGTDSFLYRRSVSHPPGESYSYHILDFRECTWSLLRQGYQPQKYLDVDFVPIYGSDKVFFMNTLTAGSGLMFEIYDHSTGETSEVYSTMQIKYPNRTDAVICSIADSAKVLFYGGRGGIYPDTVYLSDTWIFDLATLKWTELHPPVSPPARFYQGIAPVYGTDKVVMFGGLNDTLLDETWVFDISDCIWTLANSSVSPPACDFIEMASVPRTDLVLLFGGWDGSENLDGTWSFDVERMEWEEADTKDSPLARSKYFMTEAPSTDEVLMWGGFGDYDRVHLFHADRYVRDGSYVTDPFHLGSNLTLRSVKWEGFVPEGTSIEFQIRTGSSPEGIDDAGFTGPDDLPLALFSGERAIFNRNLDDDAYVQLRYVLTTSVIFRTPVLFGAYLEFDHFPEIAVLSPDAYTITNGTGMELRWIYWDDDGDDQTDVEVQFGRDLSDFIPEMACSAANVSGTEMTIGEVDLSEGVWYWRMLVKDSSGSWSRPSEPRPILVDRSGPESEILFPTNRATMKDLGTIEGHANDINDGEGIDSVWVGIMRGSDGRYLRDGKWVANRTVMRANGNENWNLSLGGLVLPDGPYSIFSIAMDKAGNWQIDRSECNIFLDRSGPSKARVVIEGGAAETNDTIIDLTLACEDPSLPLSMSFSTDGATWTDWVDFTPTYRIVLPEGEGKKTILFRARDAMGNIGEIASDSIILNTTKGDGGHVQDTNSTDRVDDRLPVVIILVLASIIAVLASITVVVVLLLRSSRKDREGNVKAE